VVISAPHRHHNQGKVFHVNILLNLPGRETLVVNHEPEKNKGHEDAFVAIRDAFQSMERELEHSFKKMCDRRHVIDAQNRKRQLRGTVEKIFLQEGHGFAQGEDGVDYYFHENSVLNNAFSKLIVGDRVRFANEMGEKGPQVSSLTLVRSKSSKLENKQTENEIEKYHLYE